MHLLVKLTKTAIRLSLIVAAIPLFSHAQSPDERATAIKGLIDGQNFTFIAQTVTLQAQGERRLATNYDLVIARDKVISDLPYYGSSHAAPMDDSQDDLQFTSTEFDYTVKPRKKGGWIITIKTKDTRGSKQFTLTVLPNGYASLEVNASNLENISFNGSVASTTTAGQ